MGASFATHMLLLLWFFTATFCLSFFKAEPHVSCNEKEKQALLTLKRGLTDPGNLLSSWSSDQEDCCRWERVRCDNKTGRVTELHLSSPFDVDEPWLYYKKRLGGEISPSLLELGFLNYLNLSGNDFSLTHIPSFLGSMGSLTHLDLRWANFSRLIPHQLGNISGLRYLDLSENYFNCTPIPSFLGSMASLRHLNLYEAGFCGLIPHQLGNLSSLRYLDLGYNSDLYVDTLRWISGLSSIQYLDLSSIDLHREVDWLQIMSEIPPSISDLTFLSQLDLSYNNLSGKIPSSTQLQSFDALSYTGNPQLCGDPLPNDCNESFHNRTSIGKTEDDSENSSLYMGMGVGFAVGFWAVCGSLFFNRTWRRAYFKFLNDIKDWLYVATVLKMNWLLEKLRSCHLCK